MVVCFAGVVLIACSDYVLGDEAAEIGEEPAQDGMSSSAIANLIGCSLLMLNSICQGLVNTMTRMMQKMHWAIILFYYSVLAFLSIIIVYFCLAGSSDGGFGRAFAYNGEQFLWIFITAGFNMLALISKTISNQNEKSGIISLFGYLGIVYACLLDAFAFHEYLNWLEWLGAGIIMTTTITLTLYLLIKGEKASGE